MGMYKNNMGKKNNSAGDIDQIGVIKTITVYILCSFGEVNTKYRLFSSKIALTWRQTSTPQ